MQDLVGSFVFIVVFNIMHLEVLSNLPMKNRGSERVIYLPKVSRLVSGRGRWSPKAGVASKPLHAPTPTLPSTWGCFRRRREAGHRIRRGRCGQNLQASLCWSWFGCLEIHQCLDESLPGCGPFPWSSQGLISVTEHRVRTIKREVKGKKGGGQQG